MEFTDSRFIIPVLEIMTFFFNAHTFEESDYSTDVGAFLMIFFLINVFSFPESRMFN